MIGRYSGILEEHPYLEKLEKEIKLNIETRNELNKLIKKQRRDLECYLKRYQKQKDS